MWLQVFFNQARGLILTQEAHRETQGKLYWEENFDKSPSYQGTPCSSCDDHRPHGPSAPWPRLLSTRRVYKDITQWESRNPASLGATDLNIFVGEEWLRFAPIVKLFASTHRTLRKLLKARHEYTSLVDVLNSMKVMWIFALLSAIPLVPCVWAP